MTGKASPSVIVVSTYPPTRCGLASFSGSLMKGLVAGRQHLEGPHVARVLCRGDEFATDPLVATAFDPASTSAVSAAAARISRHDVALVQHEFGIYGPGDGTSVVDLVTEIAIPVVTTFHTLMDEPGHVPRQIVHDVAAASARIVVTVPAAAERLVERYGVSAEKIVQIPHGASWRGATTPIRLEERPIMLTWGLLTPQKGIHHAIAALPDLRDHEPQPLYWIQGATHPAVRRREGEVYRARLERLALRLGVADMVHFDDRYLDQSELEALVASAFVVVLPYERLDKVSSGVLTEAVAMGKPIVATAFTHARDLKGSDKGLVLVDSADPGQIAKALFSVLNDPEHRAAALRRRSAAPSWDVVAAQYLRVATEVVDPFPPASRGPLIQQSVSSPDASPADEIALASNDTS